MRASRLTLALAPATLFAVLGLSGCNEYDLARDEKAEAGTEEEPEEEPEPDEEPEPEPDPLNPDIELSVTTMDFGGLPKDCVTDWIPVTVKNVGGGDLEVSLIELSGSGESAYNMRSDAGDTFTLATDETADIWVNFSPTAWTTFEPSLYITSNDPDEEVVSVSIFGEGTPDPEHVEPFEQALQDKVDVLWVVDNSGSMSDDLVIVGNNFGDFIQVFIDLGIDWQMGVITTDMDNPAQSGRLVGPYLTPETPDVVNEFIRQIDLGSTGSATEVGFEAIQAALSSPIVDNENAGFMRSDAAISAIVVTDEDNSTFQSGASFASWFEALKPAAELTTFNAICEQIFISCTQYADAADLTGGITGDIASSDYASVLETISYTSAGLQVNFDLDYPPTSLSVMQVTVDGVSIPNDLHNGWTYDPSDVSITFHGSSVPQPGATGEIRYTYAEECPDL